MKRRLCIVLLLCLVCLLMSGCGLRFHVPIKSQGEKGESHDKSLSALLGFGIGKGRFEGRTTDSLSGNVSVSYQTGKHLISIRYVHMDNSGLFYPASWLVWDAGMLYGRGAKARYGSASLFVGIAAVRVARREGFRPAGLWKYDPFYTRFYTVGIPVEAQLLLLPSSRFGIGLYGYANLNQEVSFGGVLLSLHFNDIIGELR